MTAETPASGAVRLVPAAGKTPAAGTVPLRPAAGFQSLVVAGLRDAAEYRRSGWCGRCGPVAPCEDCAQGNARADEYEAAADALEQAAARGHVDALAVEAGVIFKRRFPSGRDWL